MNLQSLLSEFRRETGEVLEPFLWSDLDVTAWLNEGQIEACRRSPLLLDHESEVTLYTVTANNPVVTLDPRVNFVHVVTCPLAQWPLLATTVADMDASMSGWREQASAIPSAAIVDWGPRQIRLYPIVTQNTTLRLRVQRDPLAPMVNPTDTPEIHRPLQLVHWALFRAFSVADPRKLNANLAKHHLALFEAEFGRSPSSRHEEWRRQMRGKNVIGGPLA